MHIGIDILQPDTKWTFELVMVGGWRHISAILILSHEICQ